MSHVSIFALLMIWLSKRFQRYWDSETKKNSEDLISELYYKIPNRLSFLLKLYDYRRVSETLGLGNKKEQMKNKNPNLYYKNRNRHFYTFCCLTNDNVHNSHTMFLFIRLRNEIKPRLVHADSPEQHAKALSTSSKAKSPKGGHQRQRRFPQNVMVSTPKIIRAKIRGSLLVFMFKSCIHCLNPNGFFYLQKPLAP